MEGDQSPEPIVTEVSDTMILMELMQMPEAKLLLELATERAARKLVQHELAALRSGQLAPSPIELHNYNKNGSVPG